MQKFFALLIVATVLLSLSACSDKPATADERDPATVYDGTGASAATATRRTITIPWTTRIRPRRPTTTASERPMRTWWKTGGSATRTASCPTEKTRRTDKNSRL